MKMRRVPPTMFHREKKILSRFSYPEILFAILLLRILSVLPEYPIAKFLKKGEHGHINTLLRILMLRRAW
jgi:hypothetical protein